jgi:uncharacterized protein involved in exopolysaccharide biosynthesis
MAEDVKRTFDEQFAGAMDKIRPPVLRIWSARVKFLLINIAVDLAVLFYLLFFVKPYFESTVSILPDYGNKSTLSGLGDLVAMTGLNVGNPSPTDIYDKILQSETVLGSVLKDQYKTNKFKDSVNLIRYFGIVSEKDEAHAIEERENFLNGYLLLNSHISTDVDQITKILTIKVTMPESELSAQVANNIVRSLDNYIRGTRRSYASNQRFYLEKRVRDVKDSLMDTEEKLKAFQIENRMVDQSPELTLTRTRLLRNVDILQTVYVQITQQLELAKIDEIRDTPVINVKEFAKDPILKAGPARIRALAIIAFLTLVLSATYFAFLPKLRRYWNIVKG